MGIVEHGGIGFMQGRLSPRIAGKIQAFPAPYWREEFVLGRQHGLSMMEWTLDADGLQANPLMHAAGRQEIVTLQMAHGMAIPSCTGDCFMQAPFFKSDGGERAGRIADLDAVIDACGAIGVRWIVFPLVDNGSLTDRALEEDVYATLMNRQDRLRDLNVGIVFESDFAPEPLARYIARFPADVFGINYDIGNSAALGYDPRQELEAYGHRILNVHVKDRVRNGTTVALGRGDADFETVFALLARMRYRGNFILQTARADDDDHAGAAVRYAGMVRGWIEKHYGSGAVR